MPRRLLPALLSVGLIAAAPASLAAMLVTGQTETSFDFSVDTLATRLGVVPSLRGEASISDSDANVVGSRSSIPRTAP